MSSVSRVLAVALGLGLAAAAGFAGAAGCSKQPERAAPRMHELRALGARVEAPESWEVTATERGAYRIGAGTGKQVFVREVAFPPRTIGELYATECARAPEPGTKTTTPAGAMVVECKLISATKDGRSVELTHVASLIRIGERGIKCHFGIAGDAEAATAVCRSLRP